MENYGLSLGRSIGNLRSKLDVRQYALEVALMLPNENKLEKAKEIESYLLQEIEIAGYIDPNQSTNNFLTKVMELSARKSDNAEKKEEKTDENPI